MSRHNLLPAISWTIAVAIALIAESSTAQIVRITGSRLDSSSTARTVIRFDDAAEVRRVRVLLQSGKIDDALALAETYLGSLDDVSHAGGSAAIKDRYSALTAYCTALTSAGQTDRAIEACSEAIELIPNHWTAVNNRGAAYFVADRFDLALADYERALESAPSRNVVATIEHNIGLVRNRASSGETAR